MTDPSSLFLIGGTLAILGIATGIVYVLQTRYREVINEALVERFRHRLRGWWFMFTTLAVAFLIGSAATMVLFMFVGFWALREFITLVPTRPSDHRSLFWVFFILTPIQFVLVSYESFFGIDSYSLFSIFLPAVMFLIIPARIATADDPTRYFERVAKILMGVFLCTYCLSYAPALMTIELPAGLDSAYNVRLLFFFILMTQLGDSFRRLWAQVPVRHPIAPSINRSHTWEGLLGGLATTSLVAAGLYWATPGFTPWLAAAAGALICLMGFAGELTLSAIKRDRGVDDYGTLVPGHRGLLDRIDTICFAAPVFYHFVLFYTKIVTMWAEKVT